jgi:hypothetical protein
MPYSVSPRVVDHRVGPKPMKYFVAFMPNRLAATKWPLSCSITENSRATRKMTQPIWSTCGSSYLLSSRARALAQASTASTSSSVVTPVPDVSCSETIRATVSTILGKEILPARKSATHASLAPL